MAVSCGQLRNGNEMRDLYTLGDEWAAQAHHSTILLCYVLHQVNGRSTRLHYVASN